MPDGDPNAIITTPRPLNAENTAANTIAGAPTPAPALAPTPGGTTTTAQPPNNAQNTTQIDPTVAANIAHHSMLGKAFSALVGTQYEYHRDHETGKMVSVPVKQTPGQMFRNILAGVIVGGAAGEMGGEHPNNKNFLGGFAKGGAANIKRNEEADQRARENADKDFEASRQLKKDDEQQKTDEAHVALLTSQGLRIHSEIDAATTKQINDHRKSVLAFSEALEKGGGKYAQLQLSDGTTVNGAMSAKDFMSEVTKNPGLMNSPDKSHLRIFVDNINGEELDKVSHNGIQLVDKDGTPFNVSKATTVTAYDVPLSWANEMHPLTGQKINELAGMKLYSDKDLKRTFEVDGHSLLSLATTGQRNYLNNTRVHAEQSRLFDSAQRLRIYSQVAGAQISHLTYEESKGQTDATRAERKNIMANVAAADKMVLTLTKSLTGPTAIARTVPNPEGGKKDAQGNTQPDTIPNPAYEQTIKMLQDYQNQSKILHDQLNGTAKAPELSPEAKGQVDGEKVLSDPRLKGYSNQQIVNFVKNAKNLGISKEAKDYILNKLNPKRSALAPAPAGAPLAIGAEEEPEGGNEEEEEEEEPES